MPYTNVLPSILNNFIKMEYKILLHDERESDLLKEAILQNKSQYINKTA